MRQNMPPVLLLALVLASPLTGCAGLGSTVVDYRVWLEIGYVSADERELAIAAEPVVELANKPGPRVAFNYLQYRDSLLSWDISVGTLKIGSQISNLSDKRLVFRWDKALLSSSQQAADIPLRSYHSSVGGQILGPKGYVPKSDDRLHALVPLRLEPGQRANVSFGARYAELFHSGNLFGARFDHGSTSLHETGVGEWLLIKLPIEHGDERLMMHIKLTAREAKARISYY